MSEQVVVSIAAGVNTLRIDRPQKRNALTSRMYDALSEAFVFGESSSRVRCFLLIGTPGVFTAGNDIDELQAFADNAAIGESAIHFLKTVTSLDKPLVAAVDGLAVGIGTTYSSIATSGRQRMVDIRGPFRRPRTGAGGGRKPAPARLMGHQRAFELLVMGETFDVQRAYQAGLVNKVVCAEDVEAVAQTMAAALTAKPPEAVRTALKLMRRPSRPRAEDRQGSDELHRAVALAGGA